MEDWSHHDAQWRDTHAVAAGWEGAGETDPRLHGSRAFAICLGVSSVAIALLGVYSLANVTGLI